MFELSLHAKESVVEVVSDALEALDALSVVVEDAQANTEAESALFGEPGMPLPEQAWQLSVLKALFHTEAEARHAVTILQAQNFYSHCADVTVTALPNQDWVRLTQAQFTPVPINADFWIVPSWHDVPVGAKQVIALDPGLAFGTGTHPTTRMCLQWIAQNSTASTGLGQRVLDYGCGSGILAIAAAKYGATQVDAVDIDPDAVVATQDNARKNLVQINVGSTELALGQYDTVLANILAIPLKVLAPLLCAHVRPGGHLVLAGLLERQIDELQAAYAPYLKLQGVQCQEGWALMHGTMHG